MVVVYITPQPSPGFSSTMALLRKSSIKQRCFHCQTSLLLAALLATCALSELPGYGSGGHGKPGGGGTKSGGGGRSGGSSEGRPGGGEKLGGGGGAGAGGKGGIGGGAGRSGGAGSASGAVLGGSGDLSETIPGVAGEDFPIYAEVPDTGFTCDGQVEGGKYADPGAECQVTLF